MVQIKTALTRVIIIAIVLGLGIALYDSGSPSLSFAQKQATKKQPTIEIFGLEGQRTVFEVEVARTVAERATGLMGRTHMPLKHGMLFIFEQSMVQHFWMKNTPLSLDMIFINSKKKVVGVSKNTKPYDTSSYYVPAPSLYVLEVNAGQAEKNGIDKGSDVVFHNISKR